MTNYKTKFCGDTYEITADFAQASCPVHGDYCGRQVADFRHNAYAAMRAQLVYAVEMGGDDPEDFEDEIDAAVEAMTSTEAK